MSVQRGQVGKFKVLDFLDSAVLEHGQVGRGCRFATSCSGQIALGCFSTPIAVWDFGRFAMLQPCQVTALLGNKLETCSVSMAGWQAQSVGFACAVLEHGQVGRGCRFEHLAVEKICFTFKTVGTLCRLV